jgi:hypothetical protein
MQSIKLKEFASPKEVNQSITDAHAEFKRVFKRGAKIELAMSFDGPVNNQKYFVAAWLDGEDEEFKWFKNFFNEVN